MFQQEAHLGTISISVITELDFLDYHSQIIIYIVPTGTRTKVLRSTSVGS